MQKAIWSGSIQFGMVNVPVQLYSALNRDKKISFNNMNKETHNRVSQKIVDSVTGDEVEEIVKGYEVKKDTYVILEPEEIAGFAPDKTSTIEIITFMNEQDLDPIYYSMPYYLGTNEAGNKPYTILNKCLKSKGKAALGRMVLRNKEHLCVLRPSDRGIVLNTLTWPEQVNSILDVAPDEAEVSEKEIELGNQLIEHMTDETVIIEDLKDTYTEEVLEYIHAKAEGKSAPIRQEVQEMRDNSQDLLAALEESISQHGKSTQNV